MIIYGTTGIRSTMSNGTFYCPQCKEQHPYRQRKLVKWATLYFIPVFPMERVAEYVECSHCRSTFETSVLSFDPNWEQKFLERYTLAFANALFRVVKSSGFADADKKQIALNEYRQFIGSEVSMSELDEFFAYFENNPPIDFIQEMATELNEKAKSIILKAAINVAWADENMREAEKDAISSIAEKLDISQNEFRQLLVEGRNVAVPA